MSAIINVVNDVSSLIGIIDGVLSGRTSPHAWMFITSIVLGSFVYSVPAVIKSSESNQKSHYDYVVKRRKRLDKQIGKIIREEIKCDANLLELLMREQRVVVVEEQLGYRFNSDRIDAVLKLLATGKITPEQINTAGKCLEIKNGELHCRRGNFADTLCKMFAVFGWIICALSFTSFFVYAAKKELNYICLFDGFVYLLLVIFLLFMSRPYDTARHVEKSVYGLTKVRKSKWLRRACCLYYKVTHDHEAPILTR